jgi:hypothetical protein
MNTGDTAWVLASSALVLFMTPGLALFYGGMVRAKNVLGTLMHSVFAMGLISVLWVLIGYTLAFGPDHGGLIGGLDFIGFSGVGAEAHPDGLGATIPLGILPTGHDRTGVEIEITPAGKATKRLTLLSGGEKSLTALAFLFAVFRSRPSPFYVMDEVEAALDDTNLQRLLVIFEELRSSSQLIVITHQKRTMESADALYGVTMQGDGISQVISQKLDRPAS